MNISFAPDREDREQALRSVLACQTFARSEQLKNFLRYVCELEIAGRAGEIKEYSIGVEALGRPSSYSPTADSSVRRRAFELRQKLQDVYAGELSGNEVQIELPKGSYVPVFRFREAAPGPVDLPPELPLQALPEPKSRSPWGWMGASFVLGAVAMRLLWPLVPAGNSSAALLQEAWGPLATAQGNVLICVASNFHMLVRPGGFSPESDLPTFAAPNEIQGLYRKANPLPDGGTLIMRPART